MSPAPICGAPGPQPLALYIHTPWCLRKCPYCDFYSHVAETPPFERYVDRLLADLDWELSAPAARRPLQSIYIGGGTPSLLPGPAIQRLLDGIRSRCDLTPGIEISLEANPGARDAERFAAYRAAGVDRLSIGVQSLDAGRLRALGRVHGPDEARETVHLARSAGFENINLDLMFALPEQGLADAEHDLLELIALAPEHISYYQLTLEPNTWLHAHPPPLPDEDLTADMAERGEALLARAGYARYEVSAYARPGRRCRHNLNYWRFGDYLGIGAGAHGKLTLATPRGESWMVRRTAKRRHPTAYLDSAPDAAISSTRDLDESDLILELALNALRLTLGFERDLISRVTGLPETPIRPILNAAAADGLLRLTDTHIEPTELGRRFLDDLVARFARGA